MILRFFIVEDEPELSEFYADAIELCGHKVAGSAENGAVAIEKYSRFSPPPDIVLMDHRMPVKNGLEAAREILRMNPDARIIFASADQSVEREAMALGALLFNKKPFTIDKLIDDIRRIERLSHV